MSIGHLNNDENEDMVIVNTDIHCISIRFGSTNGSFGNQILYSTGNGSQPYWVNVAHLNNDNHSDIIVANYGTNSIGVFLGDKDGKFGNYQIYSLGPSRPISFSIGHLNDDHQLDIGVISNGTFNLIILFGKDDGSFQIGSTHFLGFDSMPSSILLNDFNGDQQADLIILNSGTNQFLVFLSNSNHTFTLHSYSTGNNSHPTSMTINHFNSDLYLDVAVLNSLSKNLLIFYGNSSGEFQTKGRSISIKGSDLQYIVSGHFTNDEIIDLAMIDSKENSLLIYKGDEGGDFSMIGEQSTGFGSEPCFILVTDLNKDNQSDLIIVNHGNNYILLLNSLHFQTTSEQTTYSTDSNSYPMFLDLVDVNNDSYVDILVANNYGSNIGVFIGFGNGSFKDEIKTAMEMDDFYPISFATGDFNSDKIVDIAVAIPYYERIEIYSGFGNGSFQFTTSIAMAPYSNIQSILVANFNNDSQADIATADYGTNQIGVYLTYENVTITSPYLYDLTTYDNSPIYIATGDLNNDSFLDIVSANNDSPTLTILYGDQNGFFENAISIDLDYYYATWIVIRDMNNDGIQDITLSSGSSTRVCVLIGDGQRNFSQIYFRMDNSDSVSWAHDLGDFNKDKIPDIAIADPITSTIVIFLLDRYQNLIRQSEILIENDYSPYCISTGHLNHDDETDVVVANPETDGITVLLIKFQAIFTNEIIYDQESGKHPNAINAADLNNDNQTDLVVVNSGSDTVEVFINYHNGRFKNTTVYSTGENSYPCYTTFTHFDRNDQLDMAIINYRKNSLSIILNPLDEKLNRSFEYFIEPKNSLPNYLAIDDVNDDNWPDVVFTNNGTNTVGVFLGFNYTRLSISNQTVNFSAKAFPTDVVIGDFNEDSIWDLVVVCERSGTVEILLGDDNGTFTTISSHAVTQSCDPMRVVIGKFDNDSHLDLAITCSGAHSLSILFGTGDGRFTRSLDYSTDSSSPVFITSADLNRDGHQDFVVANKDSNSIGIFMGNGDGSIQKQILYNTSQNSAPVWVAVGDLNNDNIPDLAVANFKGGNIGIYLGYGDGTFHYSMSHSTDNTSNPSSVAIEDFDKDNSVDIAVLNSGTKNIAIFYGYGNGTFSSPIKYSMKRNSVLKSLIVQDLNDDSILDIAVTNFIDGNTNVGIFYGLGKRRYLPAKMYTTYYPAEAASMIAKDFNEDGQMDFILSISKRDKVVIMLTGEYEPLGPLTTFPIGPSSSPSALAISHLNNDERLDIAVVNSGTNDVLILLGDGNGNFIQDKRYSTGVNTLPNSLVVKDMDNDQKNDIIVTNSKKDEIRIFYNDGNGSFALSQNYSTGYGSEPSFVSVADLDKDNLMDIVVANTGINTVLILYGSGYRTFTKQEIYSFNYDSRPKSVVIADVNNDGWLDIGVAHYQSGVVHILLHTCQLGRTIF